ncbi:unnamed protein product [Leptosia nina]|uniref:Uncharacterized protein n=1 Tax=Leptosia nina TaxID=320188 RepID=A0AAV1JLX7_9NEOP
MRKAGADNKVKKTFVRHTEQKVKNCHQVVCDLDADSSQSTAVHQIKGQLLDRPSLCSSEVLANYLSEAKNIVPQRPVIEADNLIDKVELKEKITKKLNFHFNDRIYSNLVELNADLGNTKKKEKKTKATHNSKKDLEPNIDDFCHNEKEEDNVPDIPIIKPKLKPVKWTEGKNALHKLIATFEVL